VSGAARLVAAALLVAAVVDRGFRGRSPWVVPVFATVFTALYVHDKWPASFETFEQMFAALRRR
jgi:hypothetical protein